MVCYGSVTQTCMSEYTKVELQIWLSWIYFTNSLIVAIPLVPFDFGSNAPVINAGLTGPQGRQTPWTHKKKKKKKRQQLYHKKMMDKKQIGSLQTHFVGDMAGLKQSLLTVTLGYFSFFGEDSLCEVIW